MTQIVRHQPILTHILCASVIGRGPLLKQKSSPAFHHRIEDRQLLAHAGNHGDLFRLACRDQALLHRFDFRVTLDC
jgi:hypothetical protein